jgi:hypothetical protein
MTDLTLEPNLESPDDFYAALLDAHEGLGEVESHALNARLVLVLANQIGRQAILAAAIDVARQGAGAGGRTR